MKREEKKQFILENLIYLIIWLVVFAAPFFRTGSMQGAVNWELITGMWKMALPFFILFLINTYILVPCFLIRKKSWRYVLFVSILFILFSFEPRLMSNRRNRPPDGRPFMEQPRHFPHGDDRFPPPWENRRMFDPDDPHLFKPMPGRFGFAFDRLLIAVLMLGFTIAIKFLFKSIRDDRRLRELEKHTLEIELNYLKAQINPHFFMNTLNNIHALIDMDAGKAKDTVIELSKIMRYVLYGANQTKVPLIREIQFIENYIALMRIRYTKEVDIRLQFPPDIPDTGIPPMLLMTVIENAFKHGVSYRHNSFIHIALSIEGRRLNCVVANSIPPASTSCKPGIGLENMKKRLSLLYGNNYTFDILRENESYRVTLIIPLES
jgi:hypothetical protein